jgi:hypothetical protein
MKIVKQFKEIIKDIIFYRTKPLFIKNKFIDNYLITKGLRLNITKFGKKNKKKYFYVIKRTPGAGLFSNLSFVLNHLIIAKKFNLIPVVDMENFLTFYNEKEKIFKTKNAWEYYFEKVNNYSLEQVYKSENVMFTDNIFHKNFYRDNIFKKSEVINTFKKHIKIREYYLKEANKFINKKLKHKKVLGVFLRGGEFLRISNHHFPPSINQAINKVHEILKNENYDKIFLSTIEKRYYKKFQSEFGNKVVVYPSLRSDRDLMRFYPRNLHRYKMGKEILIESLILSLADGFFYSYTNVSQFVLLLNMNKKQKKYFINNGKNHKNFLIASFYWYYKNFMPAFLGGFVK